MEAVGAVAGLLTLITFALQSTKTIHETLSSFKHGSQHVAQLASAVQTLQSMLARLQKCRAIRSPGAETNVEILSQYIKTCSDDVLRYQEELEKLRTPTTEKATGRTWKKIKVAFAEKDFHRMWIQVNQHVTSLNIQLNIINS